MGALFLATGALMLMAAVWLQRPLVLAALVTWLLFALPHTIYHLGNLGPYDTADTIGNVVTLGLTVLVPVALLALAVRSTSQGSTGGPGGASPRTESSRRPR